MNVLFSDKTGTITQGDIYLVEFITGDVRSQRTFRIGIYRGDYIKQSCKSIRRKANRK